MIVDKKIVDKKYDGGCVQFRIDWDIDTGEYNQFSDEIKYQVKQVGTIL